LLQKTLFNIEGLGRDLYPELDLWKTAQPVLQQWMRERMSPLGVLKQFRSQLPDTVEALKRLPQLFQTAVREASEGRLRLTVEHPAMRELRRELQYSNMRRDIALAAGVLWLSGSVWLTAAQHLRWLGWLQMAAAVISFAWYRSLRRQVK
jgi:ubiquinone biosynthesis protein